MKTEQKCGLILALLLLIVSTSQVSTTAFASSTDTYSISSSGTIGTIVTNMVENPDFDSTMLPWNTESYQLSWWSLDSGAVRVNLPAGPGTTSGGNPQGFVWSHLWNVRLPISPGQRINIRAQCMTGDALVCIGIDFWGEVSGMTSYRRGMRTGYLGYNTGWSQLSLEQDSDIAFVDGTGEETLVVQPGEGAVIIWLEVTKTTVGGVPDYTPGQAWFDNVELYIYGS